MTLTLQVKTMLAMIIAGFYVGISLDTFRYFTPLWYNKVVWRYLLEIIFWVMQTTIVFFVLYKVNAGEIRFIIFLAFLLGLSIYKALFATVYNKSLEWFIGVIKRIFRFFWKVIYYVILRPVEATLRILWAIVLFFLRLIITPIVFLLRPMKKLLDNFGKKVRKMIPKPILSNLYKYSRFYGIIKGTLTKMITYLTFQRR